MANSGKEIDIRNFESNLTGTPWAKMMITLQLILVQFFIFFFALL